MTESKPASPTTARHGYQVDVVWTGNTGQGTSSYRSYERTHEVRADGKDAIDASADPVFLGDADRYNPEELLVASLSQCHMLWFLHLAADSGVVVTGYHDQARGYLAENPDGTGQFESVELAPVVTVSDRASIDVAEALHERAHELCYIAKAVNFPVNCTPTTRIAN
ncbi:Organic hydroperoxide reductase OsmC/OhrA [Saccharopolyspora antimicrobica]|uniref:Organic hydroperoxide reductase OsmC/OhrA n=2 Tax=Saccharopolyspora TaxID=1835 RepID=A0A1I5JFD3_9PSEU|nr:MULTISPECIES: OsmC family protein [Saccharopolyspora]RKT82513.1 organic hydroperoxide reductase OsmC/OhrA [Saccharopolyspora antimicrobica]SEG86458.1 Organic hydroperoxide reductase OsmC/OhrA [Saccharopolyspora kobensis]SFE98872.1 Organic hydroperoxide reductase OsmC/OhrA [Saccharopolyspora kobensis]SFO71482.1 Organic hydroperoxide reductase OsmC/OhrA [Saccharopolyspora antimicrobica]